MKKFNPFEIYGNSDSIKDHVINNYSRNSHLGEDFNDSKYNYNGAIKPSIETKKIASTFIFLMIGIFIILTRSFWLQVAEGVNYREIAEGNRIRIQTIKANRGVIYDRNGKQLVGNAADFVLTVIPADLPKDEREKDRILNEVANLLDINLQEIKVNLDRASKYSYEPIEIMDQIDYQKAILLQIKSGTLAGIELNVKNSRQYLETDSASHLIGYTGKITEDELKLPENKNYLLTDTIGKNGLEYQLESLLKGIDGKRRIEVDSLGKEKKVVASQEPISGENVTLTIDLGLQKVISESLNDAVKNTNSPGGAAVAIDPRNGQVLALVSSPGYDSNKFIKGMTEEEFKGLIENPDRPLFMRAVSGQYPSGSTIKPVIASAALQDNVISSKTTVLSVGGIRIGDSFFPDWKAGGHGITDVKKALAESVNTFFYAIGGGYGDINGLGVERIGYYANLFGLGQKTGIDYPNEASGFIPTKQWKEQKKGDRWYLGDTYHLAIGQGDILVTPLQVTNYMSAIANGGTLYRPMMALSADNPLTKAKTSFEPKIINDDFIDLKNINTVREGLRQAVTSGSASSLQSLTVTSAGKTGTAQTEKGVKTHAWFSGFAPYDNPEIVITVIVEEGGEGNAIALPVAKKGFEWYFSKTSSETQ